MYVTMAEMVVIMDALRASVNIGDCAGVFGYGKESRRSMHNTLLERLDNERIGVKEDDNV